jgi:hypothetical protein
MHVCAVLPPPLSLERYDLKIKIVFGMSWSARVVRIGLSNRFGQDSARFQENVENGQNKSKFLTFSKSTAKNVLQGMFCHALSFETIECEVLRMKVLHEIIEMRVQNDCTETVTQLYGLSFAPQNVTKFV